MLTRQTAESGQGAEAGDTAQPQRPARAVKSAKPDAAAATPQLPELWSRRSYAITIGVLAVIEIGLSAIQWALAPASSNGQAKAPVIIAVVELNPISLLVASLIAPMLVRPIVGERRPLRVIESLLIGVMAFFIYVYIALAAGFLLNSATPKSPATTSHTPCPTTATSCPSPAASPSAAPTATPSAAPSASASPSTSGVTPAGPFTATDAGVNVAVDVITYGLTVLIYPPLYKRLRIKPRPPRQRTPPRNKR